MSLNPIVFLTTRSQYARIKTVLEALSTTEEIDLTIALAGSALVHDYGKLEPILESDGLSVDIELDNLLDSGAPRAQAKTTGLQLIEFATVIDNHDPDVVLTTGDRYETMAVTLAASYMNVPICHFEGGEITGSIDEKVRHATTKMSDYHLVSTARSREIVEGLGEEPARIRHTGCPSIDLASRVEATRSDRYDPQTEYGGVGSTVNVDEPYAIVQYHPLPTEYQSNYEKTWEVISAMDRLGLQAFWFWPNMDAGTDQVSKAIREYREKEDPDDIRFYINLDPGDHLTLVKNADCVIGNSSVGIRECSYFGTPSVNIGKRQQFRERGPNVIDVDCEATEIREGVTHQLSHGAYDSVRLYGDGDATARIVDVLTSESFSLKPPMNPNRFDTGTTEDAAVHPPD